MENAGISTNRISKAFISYSRKDADIAENLSKALNVRGLTSYLDTKDIAPGEPWQDRLQALIQSSDVVIFVLSPASVSSEICNWEAAMAEKLQKRILPVTYRSVDDGAVPRPLARLNYIKVGDDLGQPDALEALISAWTNNLGWIREHTRLAELADVWNSRGRNRSDLLTASATARAERWLSDRPADSPQPTTIHLEYITRSRAAATTLQR